MNIKHLLQGYNARGIKAKEEIKGKIKFTNNIYAAYYQEEDYITSIKIIADTKSKSKTHGVDVISIIAHTIDLQSNSSEEQRNNILTMLGMFDGTFAKGQGCSDNDNLYTISIQKGLLMFSINDKKILEDISNSVLQGVAREEPKGIYEELVKNDRQINK